MNITRYKWPVIIAAGLHGALFVSFPPDRIAAVAAGVAKPGPLPDIPVPIDLTPPEESEAGSVGGGDPIASLPDVPSPPDMKAPFEVPMIERTAPVRPVPDLKDFTGGIGDGDIFSPGNMNAPAIPRPESQDRAPRTMAQATPRYPASLRNDGIDGEAVVEFVVGTDRRVLSADAVRWTHREFANAAVDAVLRWKFQPGTINGRKVRFRMAIPIQFSVGR